MTPYERAILKSIGIVLTEDIVYLSIAALCFLAPIMVMTIYSSIRPRRNTALLISVFDLMMFSLLVILNNVVADALHLVLRDSTTTMVQNSNAYDSRIAPLDIVLSWLQTAPVVFNDAFIIWRAWVVFQKQKWALYLSASLCALAAVFSLTYLSLMSVPGATQKAAAHPGVTIAVIYTTSLVMSLATNLVATLFIAWILRYLDDSLRPMFKLKNILVLLMDSGAVYMFLQVINLLLQTTNTPQNILCI
ncbi:hypothetical protein DXG01_014326 [Tephrocybe rancida]|nr:hypothetical protein DXG01_014326 [Tephrocybe rancida]